jgi:hypothetical protein
MEGMWDLLPGLSEGCRLLFQLSDLFSKSLLPLCSLLSLCNTPILRILISSTLLLLLLKVLFVLRTDFSPNSRFFVISEDGLLSRTTLSTTEKKARLLASKKHKS